MTFTDIKRDINSPVRLAQRISSDISLSVQASSTHYSTPREDGLDLNDYESYEIAILDRNVAGFGRPKYYGMPAYFESLFESEELNNPVAGWVSREDVIDIMGHLRRYMPVELL